MPHPQQPPQLPPSNQQQSIQPANGATTTPQQQQQQQPLPPAQQTPPSLHKQEQHITPPGSQQNHQPPQPLAGFYQQPMQLPGFGQPQDYHEILPKFSSQLKTNFENRNLWLRFGLTLALSKESPQSALQAFYECMRIDQDDPLPAMLAAKLLLEELDDPERALEVAGEAIDRCKRQLLTTKPNTGVGISVPGAGKANSLENSSIEMICSSVSSLSTSNNSSSQSTIIQGPTSSVKADVAVEQSVESHQQTNSNNNNSIVDHLKNQSNGKEKSSTSYYRNIAPLLSRCYVLASVTHAYLYEREPVSIRQLFKETNLKASLDLLDSAQETNPQDHLVYFHKALYEASQRTYPKAIDNLRRAIQINPHHIPSIQLLILSLSALKLYDQALTLCESILREYENDLVLLYIKCNLEQCLVETKGYKVALGTAQHMLKCIRQSTLCVNHVNGHTRNYSSTTTISVAAQSLQCQGQQQHQQQQLQQSSQQNTLVHSTNSNSTAAAAPSAAGSLIVANSLAATPTKDASNNNNNNNNNQAALLNPAGDNKQISNLLSESSSTPIAGRVEFLSGGELSVWILVAEIFVKIGSVEDAEMCVEEAEAHVNGSLSHQILYIKGLITKAKSQLVEAKTFFQSCLALRPKHAKALQQIAHVHYLLGNYSTAEKFLKDSLDLDQECHKTWYYLSLVYIELNQHDRANECVKKSTTLEETSPSVPISIISRLTLQ